MTERRRLFHALAGMAAAAVFATSCTTVPSAPLVVLDEAAVAARAAGEEGRLLERVSVYDDPALAGYLAAVAARVAPDAPVTITVVLDPTLDAFAMPGGHLYLHTGLVSRLHGELQLATVLARELARLRRGDAGVSRDASKAGVAAAMAAAARAPGAGDAGGAVLSPLARAVLGLGLDVACTASMVGYGRQAERDADRAAVAALAAAGYDPAQAPETFETLRDRARDGGPLERFLLGNDAFLTERGEGMRAAAASAVAVAGAPVKDAAAFAALVLPLVRENARLELRAGRFRLARAELDRVLRATPGDAVAHVYAGDLARLRAQRVRSLADRDELARAARESYEQAITLSPGFAAPFRELGLLYYQQHRLDQAREAFTRYVALAPDAADARRIEAYLVLLDR